LILNPSGVIGVNALRTTPWTAATPVPIHAHIAANMGTIAYNAERGSSIKVLKQTKSLNKRYPTQGRKL